MLNHAGKRLRFQKRIDAIVKVIGILNDRTCRKPCEMTRQQLGLSYDPDKCVPQNTVRDGVMEVYRDTFGTQDEFFERLEQAIKEGQILKETGWASRDEASRKTTAEWVLSLPTMV